MANFAADEIDLLNMVNIYCKKLRFRPSYNVDRKEFIRLTNPTDRMIGFKVKTTRLQQLYTNPPYGALKPKRGIYVRVGFRKLLGDFDLKPDRLTVCLCIVPYSKENMKPSTFWKTCTPSTVRHFTIEVEYDPAIEGTPPVREPPPPPPPPPTGPPKKMKEDEEDEEEVSE
ncbi:hypothetical protein M514_00957, partial [Trichuris suis]